MAITRQSDLASISYNPNGEITVFEKHTYDDGSIEHTTQDSRKVVPGYLVDGVYTITQAVQDEHAPVVNLMGLWDNDLHSNYQSYLEGQV